MHIVGKGRAVSAFIGESDHWHGKPLYLAIVEAAKSLGLAGATVTRGITGFGANSRIHTASILRLSEDLPVVITIIDNEERIAKLLPVLDEMVGEGLVASWPVNIETYRHNQTAKH